MFSLLKALVLLVFIIVYNYYLVSPLLEVMVQDATEEADQDQHGSEYADSQYNEEEIGSMNERDVL